LKIAVDERNLGEIRRGRFSFSTTTEKVLLDVY
jgi:hypothetical protein